MLKIKQNMNINYKTTKLLSKYEAWKYLYYSNIIFQYSEPALTISDRRQNIQVY